MKKATKGLANRPLTLQLLLEVHCEPAAEEKHANCYAQHQEPTDECTLEKRQRTALLREEVGNCDVVVGVGGAGHWTNEQEQKEKDRQDEGEQVDDSDRTDSKPSLVVPGRCQSVF